MKSCELYGCIYNEDGICKYNEAPIKVEYAQACHEEFIEEE